MSAENLSKYIEAPVHRTNQVSFSAGTAQQASSAKLRFELPLPGKSPEASSAFGRIPPLSGLSEEKKAEAQSKRSGASLGQAPLLRGCPDIQKSEQLSADPPQDKNNNKFEKNMEVHRSSITHTQGISRSGKSCSKDVELHQASTGESGMKLRENAWRQKAVIERRTLPKSSQILFDLQCSPVTEPPESNVILVTERSRPAKPDPLSNLDSAKKRNAKKGWRKLPSPSAIAAKSTQSQSLSHSAGEADQVFKWPKLSLSDAPPSSKRLEQAEAAASTSGDGPKGMRTSEACKEKETVPAMKLGGRIFQLSKKPCFVVEKPNQDQQQQGTLQHITINSDSISNPAIRGQIPPGTEVEVIWGVLLEKLPFSSMEVSYCVPHTDKYRIYKYKNPKTQRTLKLLKCEYNGCEKTFTKWHNFYDHLRFHTKERPYECPFKKSLGCDLSFTQKSNLNKHIIANHGEEQKALLGKRNKG